MSLGPYQIKKLAVVTLATNGYSVLGLRLLSKWMFHYKGDMDVTLYFFGDIDPRPYLPTTLKVRYMPTKHSSWTEATDSKYSCILSMQNEPFDFLLYIDADTESKKMFGDTWFLCDGLVGLQHFGDSSYMKDRPDLKTFERNPVSKAYVPLDSNKPQIYYSASFFGGIKNKVLSFCQVIDENLKEDKRKHYEARVNDESHLNWYFHYNLPTLLVLSGNYPLEISDKGGFDNMRLPMDQSYLLEEIKKVKDSRWTLRSKTVILS